MLGGSEQLCRLVAERLAGQHDVEVLTTCAHDYVTWKNDYQEGADRVRGVTVRRFASARTRDLESFNRYSDWIYNNPHTRADEMEWLKAAAEALPRQRPVHGGEIFGRRDVEARMPAPSNRCDEPNSRRCTRFQVFLAAAIEG